MIEHFKKFDDKDKSLLPLSFSHLNEFAFYRERWALRRIFGYEFPTSASAIRGQAVESGLNMVLNGISIEEASLKMLDEYDDNCSRITDPKIEEERNNLVPLLDLGAKTFQHYAFRWELLDYQKKVESWYKHNLKGKNKHRISAIPPKPYQERFCKFISDICRFIIHTNLIKLLYSRLSLYYIVV